MSEPTEADPYPDGLPEDLYVDIESTIHQHCGHDGQSDEVNDWVTDLMAALTPLIVRALVGGRSAAPTREQIDAKAIRWANQFARKASDAGTHFTEEGVLTLAESFADAVVALLSRPAEPPEGERTLAEARSLMRTARSLDPTKPASNELLGQVFGDLIDLLAPDGATAEPKEPGDD